jgi:outer membrane protein assembly factor BamD
MIPHGPHSRRFGRRRSPLPFLFSATRSLVFLVTIGCVTAACAGDKGRIPVAPGEADKFLYDRGIAQLNDRKWLSAREYLQQLVDNYPQSPHRADAKLGIGDSYLVENTTESLITAISEFREFLTYFPTHLRADYAQFKIGLAHYLQMRGPERDQTETKEAVKEFELFVERYPNSALMNEVKAKLRESRDRLSESEYRVGLYYYRARWYPGAIDRFKALLKVDPEFTNRDAVYFYLAESLVKSDKKAEALPYYERLVKEFQSSEFLEQAQRRLDEFKALASPAI